MSTFVFANNVNTTLAAGINSTATTITLTSSAHLPTLVAGEIFALTLNDAATQSVYEIVYVTAISGATLTVIRGQENTAAQSWLTNDYAYASNTAGILGSFIQSGSEPGSGFVVLNPTSQQSGSTNVSGTGNSGSGNASVAGDGGFGRSASSGAVLLGGSASSAEIDYGVTTSGVVTVNKPLAIEGAVSGGVVTAPLAPCYTTSGAASPSTMKSVVGSFSTNASNPQVSQTMTLLGSFLVNLSGEAVFSANLSYSVQASWYLMSYSGTAPIIYSVIVTNESASSFQISFYGQTGNVATTNLIISGTFTAKGY